MDKCPIHNRPLLTANGRAGFCFECEDYPAGAASAKPSKAKQQKSFSQETQVLTPDIYKALKACGRVALRVGQWRADRAGSDPGVPDIIVWDATRQGWIGLEVKTERGTLSPAQQALHDIGAIIIVRSVAEALEAVGETL